MIGRARELARLSEALANLPAVVAISGEPGIGKSRLLHALRESALPRRAGAVAGARPSSSASFPTARSSTRSTRTCGTLSDTQLRGLDTAQLGGIFPALGRQPPRRRCSPSSATARTAR